MASLFHSVAGMVGLAVTAEPLKLLVLLSLLLVKRVI